MRYAVSHPILYREEKLVSLWVVFRSAGVSFLLTSLSS